MTVARQAADSRPHARYVGLGDASTRPTGAGETGPSFAIDRLTAALAPIRGLPRNRRALAACAIALIGLVAVLGMLGSGQPAAPVSAAAASPDTSGVFGAGVAGPNLLDLGAKAVLVLVLLGVTLRVLRRVQAGPAAGSAQLVVLESRSLAPKASLHLLAVGERRLVIGLTPAGMVALADLDRGDLPAIEAGSADLPNVIPALPGALPDALRAAISRLVPSVGRR